MSLQSCYDAEDVIQQLNVILSKAVGFPSAPDSKEGLSHDDIPAEEETLRNMSCVQSRIARALSTRPLDQNKSMIETLDHP